MPLREANEAVRVARPQTKRRTAQRPSREGAFGAPLFNHVSTTVVRLREERPRARAGATSAWRGCSVTQMCRTRTLVPNAKVGDRYPFQVQICGFHANSASTTRHR